MMLNMFKSDIFRAFKQPGFWVMVAISVLLMVFIAWMMAWISSPDFNTYINDTIENSVEESELTSEDVDELMVASEQLEPLNSKTIQSVIDVWMPSFLDGGFLGLIGSLIVTCLFAMDFKGGYIKNFALDKTGRRIYYSEKLIFGALIQLGMLALLAVSSVLSYLAFGFVFETSTPVSDIILWLLSAWLIACAYASVCACIVWSVRAEWAGVVSSLLISTGAFGAILYQLIMFSASIFPPLSTIAAWLPSTCISAMRDHGINMLAPDFTAPFVGMPVVSHVALVCILFIAICSALSLTVIKNRDIR